MFWKVRIPKNVSARHVRNAVSSVRARAVEHPFLQRGYLGARAGRGARGR